METAISDERKKELWKLGMESIRELETERGIFASSRQEIYGCIFGRDSLITAIMLLEVYKTTKDDYLLQLVQKILVNLAQLQGTQVNIESGEEPGKCIHEFRPERHEHLTQDPNHPWYVYSDGIMRNYDTVDATPLFLIALHKYYKLTRDEELLAFLMPNIQAGLDWLLTFADSNDDGLLDYQFKQDRKFGGLRTQSWMDSTESVFFEEGGGKPIYPIAPIEVQAYGFAALCRWSAYFAGSDQTQSERLRERSRQLQNATTLRFAMENNVFPFAFDGSGRPLTSTRSSIGHLLWTGWGKESAIEHSHIATIVRKLMSPDMFIPEAGLRTLSTESSQFEANSYHNGSIWPHDTMIVAEGMRKFGFTDEARKLRQALLKTYAYFNTPLELFIYDENGFGEYRSPMGQGACRVQAWSAATLLLLLAQENVVSE